MVRHSAIDSMEGLRETPVLVAAHKSCHSTEPVVPDHQSWAARQEAHWLVPGKLDWLAASRAVGLWSSLALRVAWSVLPAAPREVQRRADWEVSAAHKDRTA